MSQRTLEARIYEVYERLTPAERRLGHVLLEYQQNLPAMTAAELAAIAGVSKSTAARLIRTLGYVSFPQARREVRGERFWGSPQSQIDTGAPPPESVWPGRMLETDLANIRLTFETLPEQLLDRVASRMAAAKTLRILGLRSGYGLAHHAAHYFTLIHDNVHVISSRGGAYSHEIASIREGDVLLVIAFRRRPRFLPELLDHARGNGAHSVLITDFSAAASAKASGDVIRCRCQSPSPFNSFVAAVTILNYLAWKVADIRGDAATDRIRRVDELVPILDRVATPAVRGS
jgi:DNA-binding MurR/RpiR family transcriptional regulator